MKRCNKEELNELIAKCVKYEQKARISHSDFAEVLEKAINILGETRIAEAFGERKIRLKRW